MPVYRGGWGHREAKKKFIRELPVSVKNDDSVLWGEKSVNSLNLQLTDKMPGGGASQGDYLIYGWKPFLYFLSVPMIAGLATGLGSLIDVIFFRGQGNLFGAWEDIILGFGLVIVWGCYAFLSPYDRYVVFDRRNRLVHLPRWFSRKQDSIRWEEADFGIIDVRLGQFWNEKGTNLYVVKPPWSLLHQGYFNWRTAICIHEESKQWHELSQEGHYVNGAESVFRFIVDFMTRPPERSVALDYIASMDQVLEDRGNIDYVPSIYGYHFQWIDPERLPTEPNWLRAADGHWQQLAPPVTVRVGWFGLWGRSHTLMPHLRGTRSDPAFHDDPEAPLPGSRWIAVEDGGTGELVGQPPEVIRAVLQGQGMPSKEQLDATRLEEGGWPGKFSEREKWYEGH